MSLRLKPTFLDPQFELGYFDLEAMTGFTIVPQPVSVFTRSGPFFSHGGEPLGRRCRGTETAVKSFAIALIEIRQMNTKIKPERAEILRLRARIVAVERATLAALELVLLLKPKELEAFLESRRKELSQNYLDETFATDLVDPAERDFVAEEVERLMRALQSEMDFKGGVSTPESG